MKTCLRMMAGSAVILMSVCGSLWAHCQIPCGIYGDETRFTMMVEHVTTIEKSMKEIVSLGEADAPNWNQLVRWVNNKDAHADELAHIITFYFMAQRVKPAPPEDKAAHEKYIGQIATLHKMLTLAMKAKQTTDLENCTQLRSLIGEFKDSYMGQ